MKDKLIILIAFFCMLASPGSLASEYQSNFDRLPAVERYPIQAGTWSRTPTIIVCSYAPVERDHIDKAMRFWSDLGHRFLRIQYKYDPLDKCLIKEPVGYITIHLVHQDLKLDPESLAETHFFVNSDTKEIEWAIIYMRSISITRETVLEHEIGHALGYLHYNKINHLMNSKWTQGGWDKSGLENRHQ